MDGDTTDELRRIRRLMIRIVIVVVAAAIVFALYHSQQTAKRHGDCVNTHILAGESNALAEASC